MDHGKRRINPDFVLNQPRYQGAQILLARDNFGCGSSREHARGAHGLRIPGYHRASYADIFYNNSFKNGLLRSFWSAMRWIAFSARPKRRRVTGWLWTSSRKRDDAIGRRVQVRD